jgi:hypothetical protein
VNVHLNQLNVLLPEYVNAVEAARQNLEMATIAADSAQSGLAEAEPLLEKVFRWDADIENQQQQTARSEVQQQQLQASVKLLETQEIKETEILRQLDLSIAEHQAWLKKNERDQHLDKHLLILKEHQRKLQEIDSTMNAALLEQQDFQSSGLKEQELLEADTSKLEQYRIEFEKKKKQTGELGTKLETNYHGLQLEEMESAQSRLPKLISICEGQLRLANSLLKNTKEQGILNELISKDQVSLEEASNALSTFRQKKEGAEMYLSDLGME